jgi:7,8-dihydropterin-6-yl-methyl-4-(beta-D-ribofuranosyl)aminobenzene 5'-phosphate synthase
MSIELTQPDAFAAPVVESLSVRLLVDSVYDRFIADASHPMVKIEHVRHITGHERSTLAGEWGLSLHLESAQPAGRSQYLLDFGYTPEILIRNFELLDLDPSRIDGLILSHGHRDHYGGLEGFVNHYRSRMLPGLKLFAGGEANFREKWIKRRDAEPVSWGLLDRKALEAADVSPVCCDTPHALQGAFTTGYIPRQSFERVLENTLVKRADPTQAHLPTIFPRPSGRAASCSTSTRTNTRLATLCRGAGLLSFLHAAMSGSSTRSRPRWRCRASANYTRSSAGFISARHPRTTSITR